VKAAGQNQREILFFHDTGALDMVAIGSGNVARPVVPGITIVAVAISFTLQIGLNDGAFKTS
jgi:hypothetical protein